MLSSSRYLLSNLPNFLRLPLQSFPDDSFSNFSSWSTSHHFSFIQNNCEIRSFDSFNSMRNHQHRRLSHLLSQNLLNLHARLHINTRRRLIQNNDRTSPQHRPRKSNELPLALREVTSTSLDRCLEGPVVAVADSF